MSKQDKIFQMLDEMVITLNEQEQRLAKKVETGQLKNYERHNQLNQLYLTTLRSTAEDIAGNNDHTDYDRGYNSGYIAGKREQLKEGS